MAWYVISYDIKKTTQDPHSEFLNQADSVGWKVWVYSGTVKKWYRLPNTTLVGAFANRDAALKAFKNAIASTSKALGIAVTVEKFFLSACASTLFNSDVIVDD
ncbi:hypothetical protein PYH37_000628 [Sinorhizobium numidicum]|uniref:Uncharacterized protein n=1 Tax=Sinorhizobium numidicum TaxID=680248 RepID=A0ABY8CWX4_9HYPH|nr:hypothetical protein [Sinorhizobium numidicum]WEX75243.1 hypothetical protein PYH37_000628 [Sinorhizobium numidicum]WEX81238.1 hypothetical protein PYH38_000630 [Sinorhizobium numidicum]